MDWMNNRGNRPAQTANVGASPAQPAAPVAERSASGKDQGKGMRIASVGLIFVATALLLALLASVILNNGKSSSGQDKFVNTKQMQAVFLNGGQVYFGNISDINDKYLNLKDIYYLRVNQQVQPNGTASSGQDISLVKLGCELHGPNDQMTINQSQVIFWENLKTDGQVAKAVEKYKSDNPNGQKCEDTAQSNGASNQATTPSTSNGTNTNTSNGANNSGN